MTFRDPAETLAVFTLLVSWLLVACVPGLLMLATFGLGRLEEALAHDTVTTPTSPIPRAGEP